MTQTHVAKVDAHHHLWDPELYSYPLLARSGSASSNRYLYADFMADAADQNLVKSVHLQGEIAREHTVDETEWLQGIANEHGFPHAIVAYAALEDPDLDATLEAHARARNFRGIRQILNPDQVRRADLLTDTAWRAGYARLAERGLSFDLQADPEQMADAAQVARSSPDVPMIINHTGMPRDRSPDGLERWRTGLRLLAELPQVSIKISGFGMWKEPVTVESIRPLVLETIDIFGTARCMFASNFPVDKRAVTYTQLYSAFEAVTSAFSPSERDDMFRRNAERIYRI